MYDVRLVHVFMPTAQERRSSGSEKPSLWVKEFRLPRRASRPATEATVVVAAAEEAVPATEQPKSQPFWKKEIRLGRARSEALPVEPATEDEVVAEDAVAAVDKPRSQPFWKKEIRFGRARSEAQPEEAEPVVEAEPVPAEVVDESVEDETPASKRSRRRRRRARARAERSEPIEELADDEFVLEVEEPVAEIVPLPVPTPTPEPEPELEPVASEPAAEPEAELLDDEVAEEVEPEPVVAPELVADAEEVEADADTDTVDLDEAVEADELADELPVADAEPEELTEELPVADADPEPAEEPVPAVLELVEPIELEDAEPVEPLVAEPIEVAPPVLELVEPEPEVVAAVEPELASEPEPEPEQEQKPARRRLSFGRKSRSAADEAEPVEKPRKRRAEKAEGGKAVRGRRGKKEIVGLKIGASKVAAAFVSNNGSPELLQIAQEPLEQGVVVGGELRDPEALAETLASFFKKHKLPKRGIRLGVASNRIGVRSFTLSGIEDPKQLTNAVRFRAQDALPIPLNEAALDYHVLEETVDAAGVTHRRVLLVVAYRDLVDRYVEACRKAGLKLIGVDLEAFAVLRALAMPRPVDQPSDGALVVVSIGHDASLLAVSDGRVCEFTRMLDWGGSGIDVAIARALDITPLEAEPIKRGLSLSDPTAPLEGLTAEQAAKVREAASDQLQGFARELVSSLHFYQSQPGSLEIAEVVLTGGGANLAGLAEELGRLTGVRVRVGDPLVRLSLAKKVTPPQAVGSMSVAIGLGIED
jgi:type IV pilus assembly protein PilM